MPSVFYRALSACLCAVSVAMHATAQPHVDPHQQTAKSVGQALTLRDAIQITIRSNPELKVFAYELRAQEARVDLARLGTPLEFSVEMENVLGTGEARGFDAAEGTFALSKVLELGHKRSRRVEAALAERAHVSIEQQAAQLDQIAELVRRFVHLASDQKQLELTAEAVRLALTTVDAVKRRVQAAKSPEVELHRANIELIRAEVELEHAEHELLSSRVKLAAVMGETEPSFTSVDADLYTLPAPAPFELFASQLERNPDFTKFTTAARLRDAELRLAHAHRRADVTVSAGVRRLQEVDDQAFVVGFAMPLKARSRGAPAIAEATALRGQVDAQREAETITARAQLFEIYQELRHSMTEAQTYRDRVLPQMQEALRETEYAYERGRYSYIELVDAQRAYIEVQRQLIEAAANAHTFQAEIERLTAQPLPATGESP